MIFKKTFLGQTIIKYQVPLEIFIGLNELYETQKKHLPSATPQLAGKIAEESSMFYAGPDNKIMHGHNFLTEEILKWFVYVFKHYLDNLQTGKLEYDLSINSVWVNEMKAGDYNPVHIHQGRIFTGLSSVMFLKLPKDMGPELARPDQPMNGKLQILGNVAGQFVTSDFSPKLKIGDFYVFPYDMRHVVYPFTNKKEKRRTLVCNCDVSYDSVRSRTAE